MIGLKEFRTVADAMGEMGASALQKITAVIHIFSYGVCFDAIEEYTDVTRKVARDCLYSFCDKLDEAHFDSCTLSIHIISTLFILRCKRSYHTFLVPSILFNHLFQYVKSSKRRPLAMSYSI